MSELKPLKLDAGIGGTIIPAGEDAAYQRGRREGWDAAMNACAEEASHFACHPHYLQLDRWCYTQVGHCPPAGEEAT